MEIQQRIAQAFSGTEWEGKVWLVGGCVRDKLLGQPLGHDIDLVVQGDALRAAHHLHQIGAAKTEPAVYPRFGTAMVRFGDLDVELVTARRESYSDDSRKPNTEPATVTEDLYRRDFTINTLLLNPWTGEIEDRLGQGLFDLKKRILRTPVAPDMTFYDDPLRMLRAVRFRQRFEMEYAEGLPEAIREMAYRLEIISRERIQDELLKIISADGARQGVADLIDLGLMEKVFPGIGNEVLERLGACEPDSLSRMAALLLPYGPTKAGQALKEMKFSGDFSRDVRLILEGEKHVKPEMTLVDMRRLIHDLSKLAERIVQFALTRPGWKAEDAERVETIFAAAAREEGFATRFASPLSGTEISSLLGLAEGPEIGKIKEALAQAVISGKLGGADTERAKELAREIYRTLDGRTDVEDGQVE